MKPYDGKPRKDRDCGCCGDFKKSTTKKPRRAAARQMSKIEIKNELEQNTLSYDDFRRATLLYNEEIIVEYNSSLLYSFMHSLRSIAPELGWADSDQGWGIYSLDPRGLSAIPHKYKNWSPSTEEERSQLIEKICRESNRYG